MKKMLARLLLLLTIGFTFLNGSCDKDNDPDPTLNGNPITENSARYLCAIGIVADNRLDTLVYNSRPGYWDVMTEYNEWVDEGDKVMFESAGSNSNIYRIVFKTPYIQGPDNASHSYLGIGSGYLHNHPEVIGCDYPSEPKKTIGEDTNFIIEGDDNGFTIESKKYPGFYLQPRTWRNATYPTQSLLVFCQGSHTFFFLDE